MLKEEIVQEIANRMADPLSLYEGLMERGQKNLSNPITYWSSCSLSHGYPGMLLLLATMSDIYKEEKWENACHAYVLKIKESLEKEGVSNFSLFSGLAGVCFSIQVASQKGTRYQKLLSKLNDFLIEGVKRDYIQPLREKIALRLPARMEWYDVVSGISGIGIYLFNNLHITSCGILLEEVVKICIELLKGSVQIGEHTVPGWYCPHHYQFTEEDKKKYPCGNFNLGLAHGVTGLIAFLSILSLRKWEVKGQRECIERGGLWLEAKKKQYKENILWPDRISFEEEIRPTSSFNLNQSYVEAWCYGTAGVARSFYLAGKVLKREDWKSLAAQAFLSIFSRLQLINPTFCHGLAGLLTMTNLMARDLNSKVLEHHSLLLETQLLSTYHSSYLFGFRDQEPILKGESILHTESGNLKTVGVDKIGILDGASGVLLSLLFQKNKYFPWIDVFLIEDKHD